MAYQRKCDRCGNIIPPENNYLVVHQVAGKMVISCGGDLCAACWKEITAKP